MVSPRRRTVIINSSLALGVVLALVIGLGALGGDRGALDEPTTATVTRGTVIGAVAASGEVVAPGDLGVSFQVAGEVVEVLVDVGQRVRAGEVMARLDTSEFTDQLTVAQAQANAAEAALTQVRQGRTSQQQRVSSLQRAQADLRIRQAEAALAHAEELYELGLDALDDQVDAAEDLRDLTREARDEARDAYDDACDPLPDPLTTECMTAQQGRATAEQRHREASNALDAARANRDQGRVQQRQALDQARDRVDDARAGRDLTLAQDDAAAVVTRAERTQAESQAAQARAQVSQAERALERAELRAPAAGTVAQVTVNAGDVVAGGPGMEGDAVLLTDVDEREISALFSEADAARIEVGQPAVVTFDALPEVTLNGRVRRVDVTPTITGNLVRYGVRITVEELPDAVRTGQTATAEIITGQADDTLYVPTTAVSTVGRDTTVIVWDGETREERDVEIGIQGDQHTEILAGLEEGELVVLPTAGEGLIPDVMGPGGFQEPATEPAGSGDG